VGAGPSTRLMVVSAISLVIVALLSILIARREASDSSQANPAQFAVNGALQAAGKIYRSNHDSFPRGKDLTSKLQRDDSSLTFAFGPQSVVSADNTRLYNATGISVSVSGDGQVVMFAAPGSNRTCWYATENHEADGTPSGLRGASRSSGTNYAVAASQRSCTAGILLPANVTSWTASWPST